MPYVDCSQSRKRMLLRARHSKDLGARALERASDDAAAEARGTSAFHDRTSRTRGSIRPGLGPGPHRSRVDAGGSAVFLESGTGRFGPRGRDYVIAAKNGGYLTFRVNGHWVRTSHVVHPGVHATHFMRDAAEKTRPSFVRNCVDAMHAMAAGR